MNRREKARLAIWRSLLRVVPETRSGDYLLSLLFFIARHGRLPRNQPIFNDVLFRIKTTNEIVDPLRVFVSDKEFVKLYVRAIVGEQFNVPTLAVLGSPEAVESYPFPDRCCIKPTHLSGAVIIRDHGEPIDLTRIRGWFQRSLYREEREANYKTLKPKVIVEDLVFDNSNASDYKCFCYQGTPRLIQVDFDRFLDHKRKLFDPNWHEMPFSILYPPCDEHVEKPKNLEAMLDLAGRLSKNFSFVRVDLYSDGEDVLVGELTLCHGSAGESFVPRSAEFLASREMFR